MEKEQQTSALSNPFNIFAGGFLAATTFMFIIWGLGYVNYNQPFVFVLAALFGLFMAFNIGGNDVANSFGTSVGAGTLSVPQALAIAAIFEVSGALIAGGEVTDTIRNGIVDLNAMKIMPMEFIYIMMSSLIAAAVWLLFATKKGWPVSTTHSIIGAIVGASLTIGTILKTGNPLAMVQWGQIGQIVVSWVISPVLGGIMSFMVFKVIKDKILVLGEYDHAVYSSRANSMRHHKDEETTNEEKSASEPVMEYRPVDSKKISLIKDFHPAMTKSIGSLSMMMDVQNEGHEPKDEAEHDRARKALRLYMPLLAVIGALIVAYMLIFKGLKNLNLGLSSGQYGLIFVAIGFFTWLLTYKFIRQYRSKQLSRATFIFFSWMQVLTASCFAFSHGSNDIANAIGPFAAILEVLKEQAIVVKAPIPFVALLAFGIALISGLWFIGKEVIATVGTHLAKMSPASGFTAELAAAVVVLLASSFGLPVSSTHILVGAVLGIGLVNKNANWRLMKPIALAWVITVPAAAILSTVATLIFFYF